MLILNIETSTNVGSVSLSRDGHSWIIKEEKESGDHARQLTVFIEELMDTAKLSLKDLDAVAVSAGPGSYTGLRIGVSVAKGIAYTLQKPLIAVDTLKAIAYGVQLFDRPGPNDMIVVIQDARRMDAYAAVYKSDLSTVKSPYFLTLESDSFLEFLPEGARIFLCGNAVEKFKGISNNPSFIFSAVNCPSSRFMEQLSCEQYLEKKFEDVAYYEPFYMKPPNVTIPKNTI
jgi:tRNA threonylcarbamoyladenosine biosynthesis protein TsaB